MRLFCFAVGSNGINATPGLHYVMTYIQYTIIYIPILISCIYDVTYVM